MNDATNPVQTDPNAANATPVAVDGPVSTGSGAPGVATPDELKDALKEIFDPEIPINIVDLGLIYKLAENEGIVDVEMTLTSPHCPVGDQLKARVNEVVIKQKGVKTVNVNLVFTPPWSKEKMTFDGKLQASMLGIM